MNIMLGTEQEIDAVLRIVRQTVAEMKTYGNDQWDEHYPLRDRFVEDVANQALYVVQDEVFQNINASMNGPGLGKSGLEPTSIMGFIVVDREEPEGYELMQWRSDRPCLVVHRLAVSAEYRQRGVASAMEAFACELARDQAIPYLKVDTHSTNQRMQQFLERKGYVNTGEMMAMGKNKPFYCYDKLL